MQEQAVHILVVEDEEAVRRTIARNLEQRGYRVSEARTVAWALAVCQAGLPDAIVLDINLPDGTGWDLLRGLAAAGLPRPPVVAVSAAPLSRTRLTEFAPVDALPKPFLIPALLRAVERALAQGQGHETLDRSSV